MDDFDVDFDEWIDEEDCEDEEKEEQDKKEKAKEEDKSNKGYSLLPVGNGTEKALEIERELVIDSVKSIVLGLTKGQIEIVLRKYNWSCEELTNDWKSKTDKEQFKKEIGLTVLDTSSLAEPMKCVDNTPDITQDQKARRKMLESSLYKLVSTSMTKKGLGPRGVIRLCRGEGYPTQDIMKAIQHIKTAQVLSSMQKASSKSSKCDRAKGMVKREFGGVLGCGHFRCKDHWEGFLTYQAKQGLAGLTAKCNKLICTKLHNHSWKEQCFCEERVPRETIEKFVKDKDALAMYKRLALKTFTDNCGKVGLRQCAKCKVWWKKTGKPSTPTVYCTCGHMFCFDCGLTSHDPLPCASAKDWQNRGRDDAQTRIWRELNTATCPNPKCGIVIERYVTNSDHCLHMICSQCKHHWCWACRKPFKAGGPDANHDNYYKCRYLQAGSVGSEVKKRELILRETQMFDFYESKLKDCDEDVKHLRDLKTSLQNSIKTEEGMKEYMFLIEAVDKLIAGTQKKKILNQIAFYAAQDNKKPLFEFQLKYMAETYDHLLDILTNTPHKPVIKLPPNVQKLPKEQQQAILKQIRAALSARSVGKPLSYYKKHESDITSASKSVSDFFQKLLQKVKDGNLVTMLEKPDPTNKGWYCVKCKRSISFGQSVCECAWTTTK